MSRCDLFLENYQNKYTAGDQIIGYLQCTFVTEKIITGMSVIFHGEVSTFWDPGSAIENIFHVDIPLISDSNFTIPSGTHRYPFIYTLPQNIPSTFKGDMGNVKYSVWGLVRRSTFKQDYEAKSEINVIHPVDLNLKPNLRQPRTLKEVNDVWSFFCERWSLTSEFRLPYSGFVPGQNVPIDFLISNFTNTSIRTVQFSIIYKQNFISTYPRRAEKNNFYTIAKLKLPGIGAFNEKHYKEALKVPINFNPPNLDCSQIINTSYLLQAEICLPFYTRNIKMSHRITIGNIPLLPTIANDEPPTYNNVLSATPSPGVQFSSDQSPLPWDQTSNTESEPPNYEEAMLMITRN